MPSSEEVFEPNMQAGDAAENKEEDADGKASKGGA